MKNKKPKAGEVMKKFKKSMQLKKPKKSIQFGYFANEVYANRMLEKMKAEPEPATAKQLWVINALSLKLGQEVTLPLMKYEASLIIHQLKLDEWEKDDEGV